METLYQHLSARADGLMRWLPQQINRRGSLPATPARVRWARSVLARGDYPSRCLAERLGGGSPAGGPELARSMAAVLSRR